MEPLVSMNSMRIIPASVLKDTTEQIVKMVSNRNTKIEKRVGTDEECDISNLLAPCILGV